MCRDAVEPRLFLVVVDGANAVGALDAFIQGLNDTERNGKSAIMLLDDLGITNVRQTKAIPGALVGEVFGTAVIGGMLAYPVAKLVMGNGTAALFTFVVPFLVSTAGGTLIAALVLMLLRQTGIMGQLRSQIEDN